MTRHEIISLLKTSTGKHSTGSLRKTREKALAYISRSDNNSYILTDTIGNVKKVQLVTNVEMETTSYK